MAIVFDNSSKSTSASGAHTVTSNANGLLIVFTYGTNDTVSAITYNGIPMTNTGIVTTFLGGGRGGIRTWTLKNPSTGSNTVAITGAFSERIALSYTGVTQGTVVDASTANNQDVAASTSITCSLTSISSQTWMVMAEVDSSGGESAGTGMTARQTALTGGGIVGDSNGVLAAGSHSMTANMSSSTFQAAIALTFSSNIFTPAALFGSTFGFLAPVVKKIRLPAIFGSTFGFFAPTVPADIWTRIQKHTSTWVNQNKS